MYGYSTPPDVVSGTGGCRGSPPEVDDPTPRRPSVWMQRVRDDHVTDYMVTSSLTSSPVTSSPSPLTSSTPDGATSGKPRGTGTAARHVDFLLDESAAPTSRLDVTDGSDPVRRPTDLDVGQPPTSWNGRRRHAKSMIVIGEEDVDELFQPVSINGDSFALLQAPISDRQTSQPATQCQQTGIILSVEALQCMLAKLACSSSHEPHDTTMPPTFAARSRHQLLSQPYVPPNDRRRVPDDRLWSSMLDQKHRELQDSLLVPPRQNASSELDQHDASRWLSAENNNNRHLVMSTAVSRGSQQQQQQQQQHPHQTYSDPMRYEALIHETRCQEDNTKQRAGEVERSQTVTARRRHYIDDPSLRLRVAVADVDVAARSRCHNLQPPRPAARHLLPGKPSNVTLNVSGRSSLYVTFSAPVNTQDSNYVTATRYCVEWSYFDNFSRVVGSHMIEDEHAIGYDIQGLEPGNCYFIRVRAGNEHGFGCPATSTPPGATPSNWRDFEEMSSRHDGKQQVLDDLMEAWSNTTGGTTASASSLKNVDSSSSKVRKTFKSLFTPTVKLQKTLRRGLFVAALVHHEGRILVTGDDVVPMIDVNTEFSPATLSSDLYWLMKVASSSWYDLKSIGQRLTSCSSSQSLQFRARLLHALQQLQSALGIHDLGQFHYAPVIDEASGATLLVCVRSLDDAKAFDSTHVRWMSLKKAQTRGAAKATSPAVDGATATSGQAATADRQRSLLDGAHDMIVHRHLSGQMLPRGLYVGLLQLRSSRDSISVLVSDHQPNVLPYVRVRDNPNVTSEEWRWLVNEKLQDNSLWLRPVVRSPTSAQTTLQNQLNEACSKLLADLGKTEQEGRDFRLYDLEVLELNSDVSFLLVLPPVEAVCNSPFDGPDQESLSSHECTFVPVQAFEMLNLQAYQPELLRRYCQLSVSMETDASVAQHELRQAFSTDDSAAARRKLDAVTGLQRAVDDCWKSVRWLADVTTYARDRGVRNGLPLGALFAAADVAPTPRRRTATKHDAGRACGGRGSDATASVVGSDSDYLSDISNYSADYAATRHYQPVLL